MKKKVLLIYPPTGIFDRNDRCQSPVEEEAVRVIRPPMDLAYMAATIEREGGECRIVDYPAEGKSWKDVKADVALWRPDYLFFSSTTPTFIEDMKVCELVKAVSHHTRVVGKGAYISEHSEEVLKDFPDLDIAIVDEPEQAAGDIVAAEEPGQVLGIAHRSNSEIVRTAHRPTLRNLDELPFPSRHLLKNDLYIMPGTGEPLAIVLTSRGCPYRCTFCLVPIVTGSKLSLRSPCSLIDEVEECVNQHGIHYFWFRSDTFTLYKDWTIEVCQEILNRNLNIHWSTNSRVDCIDEERLEWMKHAGCFVIGYGVESGNQEILDKIEKEATLDQARQAVALTKQHGIKAFLFFMIGFPWDNRQTINETVHFAKELKGDLYSMAIVYPHPDTEMYKVARELRLLDDDGFFGGHYSKPAMHGTLYLSYDEVVKLSRQAYYKVVFTPSFFWRTLKNMRSFMEFKKYVANGLHLLNILKRRKSLSPKRQRS